MRELRVRSQKRKQLVEITGEVEKLFADLLVQHREGALLIFCPHTTAALAINENADPTVQRDFLQHYAKMVPKDAGFLHGEGNADAHIQSIMSGSSIMVPVSGGRMALGTWQGLYFCEFDGPRSRTALCQLLPALL